MAGTAKKTDPKLWDEVKTEVTEGDKGGKPGQWSARKAQLATSEYKSKGGNYEGPKTEDNHLRQWTEEEWGTKSDACGCRARRHALRVGSSLRWPLPVLRRPRARHPPRQR